MLTKGLMWPAFLILTRGACRQAGDVPADASWNAALDSLRQDRRVMPELSAQALRDMMPAHSTRVRGVIAMHRAMMANMGH